MSARFEGGTVAPLGNDGQDMAGHGGRMSVLTRNNVTVSGAGTQTIIFAHGFGCDQHMWRFVAPAFADRYRVVLFDHVGAGASDLSA